MKVFIWVNWGDVSVHAADTFEQCLAIYNSIDDVTYELDMGFADASRAGLLREVSNARAEHRAHIVREEISMIVDKFISCRGLFDPGTGFYDVQ